ncbi:hypothetical protein ACA910_002088 [Epithemia clementina (nom. ined.)]
MHLRLRQENESNFLWNREKTPPQIAPTQRAKERSTSDQKNKKENNDNDMCTSSPVAMDNSNQQQQQQQEQQQQQQQDPRDNSAPSSSLANDEKSQSPTRRIGPVTTFSQDHDNDNQDDSLAIDHHQQVSKNNPRTLDDQGKTTGWKDQPHPHPDQPPPPTTKTAAAAGKDDSCFDWYYSPPLLIHLYDALCLLAFVVVLLPGFVRFAWYYFVVSPTMHHRTSIRYGTQSRRQALDVYSTATTNTTTTTTITTTSTSTTTTAAVVVLPQQVHDDHKVTTTDTAKRVSSPPSHTAMTTTMTVPVVSDLSSYCDSSDGEEEDSSSHPNSTTPNNNLLEEQYGKADGGHPLCSYQPFRQCSNPSLVVVPVSSSSSSSSSSCSEIRLPVDEPLLLATMDQKDHKKSPLAGQRETCQPQAPASNPPRPGSNSQSDTNNTPTTKQSPSLRPVVLFFPGGAWMIGHKMWAALTARVLAQFGMVTVVADYRNDPFMVFGYPSPQIPDMVQDVTAAIQWTVDHIADFGGDPQRLVLVGQSAGGHLVTTALLQRAIAMQQQQQEQQQQLKQHEKQLQSPSCSSKAAATDSITWRPCDLRGLISVSAPYHFAIMDQTFRRHGLSKTVLQGMFAGRPNDSQQQEQKIQRPPQCSDDFDPFLLVQRQLQQQQPQASPLQLPPIQIWHGQRDATVPWQSAEMFGQALATLQSSSSSSSSTNNKTTAVDFTLYPTWTHTDAILEGPMSGSHEFHKELFDMVQEWTATAKPTKNDGPSLDNGEEVEDDKLSQQDQEPQWMDDHVILKPMWCPRFVAKLGRYFIPF